LSLKRGDKSGKTHVVKVMEGKELDRPQIRLPLEPGVKHAVIIQAQGYDDFTYLIELPPGAYRIQKVYFTKAVKPAS
jgi:hypothetical protein